jgi:hypothetical protein
MNVFGITDRLGSQEIYLPSGCFSRPFVLRIHVKSIESRGNAAKIVIHVYDTAGNVIEMHEHKGDFKEP